MSISLLRDFELSNQFLFLISSSTLGILLTEASFSSTLIKVSNSVSQGSSIHVVIGTALFGCSAYEVGEFYLNLTSTIFNQK